LRCVAPSAGILAIAIRKKKLKNYKAIHGKNASVFLFHGKRLTKGVFLLYLRAPLNNV